MSEPVEEEDSRFERRKIVEQYDEAYQSHAAGIAKCALSCNDIEKARTRIRLLCNYFGIGLAGKRCLDVGSGLGYYTDALDREAGKPGLVIGLDASKGATKAAKDRFPNVRFQTGFFPDALAAGDYYDLIFATDLVLVNTFDADKINREFVLPAMDLLRPSGVLVIGWHTDFSGDYRTGFCYWSLENISSIIDVCKLSQPVIVQARYPFLVRAAIWLCRLLGKSAPIFMIRRK